MRRINKLKSSVSAAAMVEYVVLVGLISVISIGVVLDLGERVKTTFNDVSDTLSETQPAVPTAEADPETETPTGTPPGIPPTSIAYGSPCLVLTGGIHDASSYPDEVCFFYSAPSEEVFVFNADNRPIMIHGGNESWSTPPTVVGDGSDNIVTVERGFNGYVEYMGEGGTDVIQSIGWGDDDMSVIDQSGSYFIDFYDHEEHFFVGDADVYNTVYISGVEEIQNNDGISDPSDFGGGPGPGPGPASCTPGSGGAGTTQSITIGPSGSPDINVVMGDGDDILNVYYTSTSDMSGGAQNNVIIDMGCGENQIIFHDLFTYTTDTPYSSGPSAYTADPDGIVEFNLREGMFPPSSVDFVIGNNDGMGFGIPIVGPTSFVDGSGEVYNTYP